MAPEALLVAVAVAVAVAVVIIVAVATRRRDTFLDRFKYAPACGDAPGWRRENRRRCDGIASGVMPAIDADDRIGGLCCGRRCGSFGGLLGVPP
jgi:hypothetical protein